MQPFDLTETILENYPHFSGNELEFDDCPGAKSPGKFLIRNGEGQFVAKLERVVGANKFQSRKKSIDLQKTISAELELIPDLAPTKRGENYVAQSPFLLSITDFVPGNDYDYSVDESASVLAQLNSLLNGEEAMIPRSLQLRLLNQFEVQKAHDWLRNSRTKFGKMARKYLTLHHESVQRIDEDISMHGFPKQLCHMNFHPANVAIQFGKIVGVFAFDQIAYEYRVQSVAKAVANFCGLEQATEYIDCYRSVQDLSEKEIQWLPDFVVRESSMQICQLIRGAMFGTATVHSIDLLRQLELLEGALRHRQEVVGEKRAFAA